MFLRWCFRFGLHQWWFGFWLDCFGSWGLWVGFSRLDLADACLPLERGGVGVFPSASGLGSDSGSGPGSERPAARMFIDENVR